MNKCCAVSLAITLLPCKPGCQRKTHCAIKPSPGSQELPHALGREGKARAPHSKPRGAGRELSEQPPGLRTSQTQEAGA